MNENDRAYYNQKRQFDYLAKHGRDMPDSLLIKKKTMDLSKYRQPGQNNISLTKGGVSGSWVGIVVIIFVFYYFLKKITSDDSGSTADGSGTGSAAGGSSGVINLMGSDMSWAEGYDSAAMQIIAQNLHDELLANWNTDEELVMSWLNPLDDVQLRLVYMKFGMVSPEGLISQFNPPKDLIWWLRQSMGGYEDQLSNIFARTNGFITY
jgi:hypothetical protein